MIKAIVTDLDRTLLRTDKSLSEYSVEVLKECRRHGLLVVAATARPKRAITDYEALIDFDAAITLNGAIVYLPSGIKENSIDKPVVMQILAELGKLPEAVVSVETSEGIYANTDIPLWSPKVYANLLEAPLPDTIFKVIVSSESINLSEVMPRILPENVYYSTANGFLYQVMSARATKWNGILELLEEYGLDADEVAFFGDDNDDLEAIRKCGLGVAVSNAIEEVKSVADVVVESNDEDGAARYIQQVILRNKA